MSKAKLTDQQQKSFALFAQDRIIGGVTLSKPSQEQESTIEATGSRDFYHPENPMTQDTISGIGSITKPFTAATLVKLWDDELTAKQTGENTKNVWFPKGIETPISHFMEGLKAKFPDCENLFNRIENDENYSKITLEHLLNHSHGLGARDDRKAVELVQTTGNRPLTLTEIANITEKREGEKFGKHLYGNFGSDLAAMIIEVVASDVNDKETSFDEAVQQYVLEPNNLQNTHPQSHHLKLYQQENADVATGFYLFGKDENGKNIPNPKEANYNIKCNTVAGGGFKSTVTDLATFAPLYFGAGMFENDEVKSVVLDTKRGAERGNGNDGKKYHLGFYKYQDGTVGHGGYDYNCTADLIYNPKTGKTFAGLWIEENLNMHIIREAFAARDPQANKVLQDFWPHFEEELRKTPGTYPKSNSDAWQKSLDEAVNTAKNKDEVIDALGKFQQLSEAISKKYSPQDLASNADGNVEKIIAEFSKPVPNYKKPTISSLLKQEDSEERTSSLITKAKQRPILNKSFVKQLEEKRENSTNENVR